MSLKRATILSTGVPQSSRASVISGAGGVVVWAVAGRAVKAAAKVRAMDAAMDGGSLEIRGCLLLVGSERVPDYLTRVGKYQTVPGGGFEK